MKKNPVIFLKLAFVLVIFLLVIVHKSRTPRVLIIHSYNTDYVWVKDINIGLERVFNENPDVTLHYHYMDLKNHQSDDFKRTATQAVHQLVDTWEPDIIILLDDLAQKLVGMRYIDDPSKIIIFGGVNGEPEDYNYDTANNVTGILERRPWEAIKEALIMIAQSSGFQLDNPDSIKPKIAFIGDKSTTMAAGLLHYSTIDWYPLTYREPPSQVGSFSEWKAEIKRLGREVDIIIVTEYRQLRKDTYTEGEEEFVKPSTVIEWTEQHSAVPVLGWVYFFVEDGGALAVSASPYEHGSVPAKMAISLIQGEKKLEDLEIVKSEQMIIAVRQSVMEKRKIPIPRIYQAFAKATENFYE